MILFRSYDDEDTRCLFMEMAEGGDLFDKIIEKVVFTEEEVSCLSCFFFCVFLKTGVFVRPKWW